jgi:hypothetical protein
MYLCLFLASFVLGCSTRQEKQLENEIAQTASVASVDQESRDVRAIIQSSTHLSDKQKNEMIVLHDKTQGKITAINQESLKLSEILAKEYSQTNCSEIEIQAIKKRMVKNSKKRLDIIFHSMHEADSILGHDELSNRGQVIDSFYYGNFGAQRF